MMVSLRAEPALRLMDSMNKPLQEVERELFGMVLKLGLSFLKEFVARHGDGKVDGKLVCEDGVGLPFHNMRKRNYLSVFGPMEIVRAYYWDSGEQGVCPLDAKLNLPQVKTSYLLEQWILADVVQMPYDKALERLEDTPHNGQSTRLIVYRKNTAIPHSGT